MQFTPVVPSLPSPDGGASNPISPPVMPVGLSPNQVPSTPAWARAQNFPNVAPYGNGTPYVQPMQVPGSYFVPPVALPQQPMMPPRAAYAAPNVQANLAQGLSADWVGFPPGNASGMDSSPYLQPASQHGSQPPTPYVSANAQPYTAANAQPYTGYNAFQQPLPAGFGMPQGAAMGGGMPMMGGMMGGGMPHAAMMGGGMAPNMMAGMMPGMVPAAMYTPFANPGAFGYTPYPAAAQGLPPQGPPGPAPGAPPAHNPAANARIFRPQDTAADKIDKFAEGPHYGPVLPAWLSYRVHAKIELNPLLMPPSHDADRDYLHWNMLFPTGKCHRASEPSYRSWSRGRHEPATWPRVDSIRLVSRAFPWTAEVHATDRAVGVTCGDIVESLQQFMYTRVTKEEMDHAPRDQKRTLYEAFNHNRSSAQGVPGGMLEQTLFRFDWLGENTMFGGIIVDPGKVREVAGVVPPCMFELVCMRRYPMSEAAAREQERRQAEAEARSQRSRSRSRINSRATSRATSRSRAATVQSDDDSD